MNIHPHNQSTFEQLKGISLARVQQAVDKLFDCRELSEPELVAFLTLANACYRNGHPIISDPDYDHKYLAELRRRDPRHPFLHQVEPELAFAGKTRSLPEPMLSIEKAYNLKAMERWAKRLEKAVKELTQEENPDIEALGIRVTPKLDGYAAYDDGDRLYTRGDGLQGTDISRVFARGLAVGGNGERGQGAGEIVIDKEYFAQYLSDHFDNSRNYQASVLAEKKQDPLVTQSIVDRAVLFIPFRQLPQWEYNLKHLFDGFDQIIETAWNSVPYEVDGVVFEVMDAELKTSMGATSHHHRWQIAFKINAEKAKATVIQVLPQTSRSGRVNPVVDIEPTRLLGVTIRRVTAHHYAMVKQQQIGPGTQIELVRSGQVIPKIEAVIKGSRAQIPKSCPSCGNKLVWQADHLICNNIQHCSAQSCKIIEYFFKTLGVVDGFGEKTIAKLYGHGIGDIVSIYRLDKEAFQAVGFGEKTSENLLQQLRLSRELPIQDWKFLAALGIARLGTGNSERLLSHYPLSEVFDLDIEQITKTKEGFLETTASLFREGLVAKKPLFEALYALGFNLVSSPLASSRGQQLASVIDGKRLVFTGKMSQSRQSMEEQAKKLGAKVGKAVSSKTDYLIVGEQVGQRKIDDAKSKGVKEIGEQEYLDWIG